MLKKIKLENWRTHKDSEFEFSAGTNVLIGNSGAGKTSVMDAICFGLFGTFPALQRRDTTTEQLIMHNPHLENYTKLQLEFVHNNSTYVIERTVFKNKTPQAKLYENERLIAGPKVREVSEKVSNILEFDYDLFSRAIYSEQNNIDYFLRLPASQRKEKFDSILDLDKYEKTRANTVKVKNKLKTRIQERGYFVEEMEKQVNEKEFDELVKKLETLKKELEEKQEHKNKQSTLLKNLEEHAALQEQRQKTHTGLEIDWIKLLSKIEELEKQIQKTKHIEKTAEEIHTKIQDIDEKLKMHQKTQQQKARLLEKKENLFKTKEKLETDLKQTMQLLPQDIENKEQLNKRITETQTKTKELEIQKQETVQAIQTHTKALLMTTEELGRLDGKESEERESILGLKKASAHCPVCRKKLEENETAKIIHEAEQLCQQILKDKKISKDKKADLEKQLEDCKHTEKELEKQNRHEQEKLASYATCSERLDRLSQQKSELKQAHEDLQELEKQITLEKEAIDPTTELTFTKKEMEEALLGKEKQAQEKQLRENASILERKIKELAFSEKDFKTLLADLEKEKAQTMHIEQEIKTQTELVQTLESKSKEIQNKKQQIIQHKENLNRLKNAHQEVVLFVNALGETQTELRAYLIDTINQAMQDLWERIYPYKDYTGIKLDIADNTYALKVQKNNKRWVGIEGLLSGGEKSTAALITRIAFSFVLARNLGWLILDEPTHNLDHNIVSRLSLIMREHLPELVDQVFLITHEKEMENAASGSLYILERDKDNNGITKPLLKN